MNNPLRYEGETFYQASYDPDDGGSILQVVHNPSWLTPYFSCVLVALGLSCNSSHLIPFLKREGRSGRSSAAGGLLKKPAEAPRFREKSHEKMDSPHSGRRDGGLGIVRLCISRRKPAFTRANSANCPC